MFMFGNNSPSLNHIHLFIKVSFEEDNFYIHLPDLVVIIGSYGEKNPN